MSKSMADVSVAALASEPIQDMSDESEIFTFEQGQFLIGTRCENCGQSALGRRSVCSKCVSSDVVTVPLPATGSLYSFTVLHIASAEPRALGYVDLDGDVRVLTDLRFGDRPISVDARVRLNTAGDDWWFE